MSTFHLPTRAPERLPDFVRDLPLDGRGKLAIFDADGTLWRDDVADDFCRWMIDSGHVQTGHRWPEYLRIYRDDHRIGCEYMLSFYEGLPLARFHELIHHWWRSVERNWVVEVTESLFVLAERGYTIWVVTGSPTDTMLPLLDFLPVDKIVGMDFEVVDGVITGRYTGISCADEGKADKVKDLWGDQNILFAAGNGSLDRWMMALAHPVIWSVYPNPSFLEVSKAEGWYILPRPADFVEEAKLAP